MKTATVRARIEPELKHDVETVFALLDVTVSEAIEMFLRQVKLRNGIPFKIRIPNKVTAETFEDTDHGRNLTCHNNAKDMFGKLGM
jgi:DNA-damage-inducible protein J